MGQLRIKTPRLAVRAVIVEQGRLLLVNAWPGGQSDLLCAPGGGVEPHASLPGNLMREVYEETGLTITVGEICLVNEFHDPEGDFHQVDIYFRAQVAAGKISQAWSDPENIVTHRRWVSREDISALRIKPDSLAEVAFTPGKTIRYDPLEPIIK